MLSGLGVIIWLVVAAAAATVAVVTVRSGGPNPGVWLLGAFVSTVAVYVYGAAQSLGSETSIASWASVAMAGCVVVGLVVLLVGRSRAAAFVVAISAVAIVLGVAGIIGSAAQ